MSKRYPKYFTNSFYAIIITLLSSIGFAQYAKSSSAPTDNQQAATRSIMAQIFSSLTNVLPLSMSNKEFSDPKNRDRILADLRNMRDGTNALVEHTKKLEGSYGFIAKSMSRDIKDIYTWYDKGALAESRYLLQQVSENCVSCHMKLPDPGHAPRMDHFFKDVSVNKLSPPEKARLQVALRQFDDALGTWEDMFKTWPKPNELFAMDTLPEYLKVVIRVKKDPKRAIMALEGLGKRTDIPTFMAREVASWKSSLKKLAPEVTKNEQELARANKIVQNARMSMEYPMDRTALVDFIVASGLLNSYMQNKKISAENTAQAYYLLGITESLIGRSTWLTQTDYYLEASVRANPKSKTALRALDALEQQILMEYSGSGGTNIPDDVQSNLDDLRNLVKR
jgi:hypothetical protein